MWWDRASVGVLIVVMYRVVFVSALCFFFQAEDGIRDLVRSRGLGDVYKRQHLPRTGKSRARGLTAFTRSNASVAF